MKLFQQSLAPDDDQNDVNLLLDRLKESVSKLPLDTVVEGIHLRRSNEFDELTTARVFFDNSSGRDDYSTDYIRFVGKGESPKVAYREVNALISEWIEKENPEDISDILIDFDVDENMHVAIASIYY